MPTWRTEWPSCLGLNPVFPRCSKTVLRLAQGLRRHPRPSRRTNNEMVSHSQWGWVVCWAGRPRKLPKDRHAAPIREDGLEVIDGNSKTSSRTKQVKVWLPTFQFSGAVQSQRMPGSSCSAACQDAHRAAPSCVTAPPSLFGGRPCSSWTWSAVSPNVRTGGRRPRCKGKLRLRGSVVCV